MSEKAVIRKIMHNLRNGMHNTEHRNLSDSVCDNAMRFLENKYMNRKRLNVGLYYPIKSEVNMIGLVKYVLSVGWTVYLPSIVDDENMVYKRFTSFDEMKNNHLGIPEPAGKGARQANRLDVVFVPGLAFDRRGFRIGYGKGYFDRFMSGVRHTGAEGSGRKTRYTTTVGICFDFQLVDKVPHENHDVKMDYVITEKEVLNTMDSTQSKIASASNRYDTGR